MLGFDIFKLVIWLIAGVSQISCKGKVEKSSYIIMWVMLIVLLIGELLETVL